MSRIFMRPEAGDNWYYESDTQPKKSMKSDGVPAGPGGKLQAEMLQNQWDNEAFYSKTGLVNPKKKWVEFRDEYLKFYAPPTHAESSYVKLKIVIKEFEKVMWPSEEALRNALMLPICDDDIVAWRNARLADGQLGQSVQAEEGYLHPMLNRAKLKGFLRADPFADLPKIRCSITEPIPLSVPQANLFLDTISQKYPHYALLGLMAYECGMRVGELVHLRIQDINFIKGTAHLLPHEKFCDCFQCKKQKAPGWMGKAGVPRPIPLSPKANVMLLQLFQDRKSGNVFEVKQDTVIRAFKRVFAASGIKDAIKGKTATHIFRHTFATHANQSGMRPFITARILGHSNRSTTDIYTHLNKEDELHAEFQKLLDWRAGAAQQAVISLH